MHAGQPPRAVLQRFGAEVLTDTLRMHPMVVVDGRVHDNAYYIDPGDFLRDTRVSSGGPPES